MGSNTGGIQIGSLKSDGRRPIFILGPCVMESRELVWEVASRLAELAVQESFPFVFKASFDKANRTSVKSFRGPGPREGARLLGEVSAEFGVPVTTDVHRAEDVGMIAEHVDLLQIPAFLCRQTDLIQAAAESGRWVNVKKGQFLAPWDVDNIAEKLRHFGCQNFFFTERGSTFGYNNLVADMRSLYWMRQKGHRVIFDATHSVQRPGGEGSSTGGDGELAPVLARAAVAAGCDGIFMETHPDPAKALSDGPNQVPLADLPQVIRQLIGIHELVRSQEEVEHV